MRIFLIKLVVFFLPIAVFAFVFDFIISSGLRKSRANDFSVWNDIFEGEIDADIVINGTSRALTGISPTILDSAQTVKSYNLGFNGYEFLMQLCRFDLYLKYNAEPKIVIHEVDYSTFGKRKDLYDIEQFFPYTNVPILQATMRKYDGLSFFDYHVPLIRYYSEYELVRMGILEYFGSAHSMGSLKDGYLANDLTWDGSFEAANVLYPKGYLAYQNKEMIRLFEEYLVSLQKHGIKVILIWIPEYIEGQRFVVNRNLVVSKFKQLASQYSLEFLDYSDDSISYNRNLFYNTRHLNKRGSEVFTRKLRRDLQELKFLENSN